MQPFKTLYKIIQADKSSRFLFIFLVALILSTTSLRLINLDADPVPWFTGEIGYQIDEGYKTLSPRNLYVFGETHWNEEDEYGGWMVNSAMTQWPYYLAFKTFGEKLSSARFVSIIYAVSFLIITALFLWQRLPHKLATLGVLLLATDPALFLYSRSALFETSIIFYVYAGIFISAALTSRMRQYAYIPLVVISTLSFFYLKKTALLYILPIALSIGFIEIRTRLNTVLMRNVIIIGLILLAITCAAMYISNFGGGSTLKINLDKYLLYPQALFLNPVHMLSPLALIIAYLIIVELLIRQPGIILDNWYRLSLVTILLLVPIMMTFFTYNVPRYHLPILPAAFLLIVERLSLNIPKEVKSKKAWFSVESMLAVVAFLALTMTVMTTSNYYIISLLPFNLGDDPGLSNIGLLKIFPIGLIFFIAIAIFIAKQYWARIDTNLYKTLIVLHILIGLGIASAALAFPAYQAQAIKQALFQHVKASESIGGDWAPFFVADTLQRALYMRPDSNGAEHVEKIRPDYFLHSSTPYDIKNFADLKKIKTIKIGNAIKIGTFAEHNITLYPIEYLRTQMQTDSLLH